MLTVCTIKLIIADDHEFFLNGLQQALNKEGGSEMEVIGLAKNGQELLDQVEKQVPDVILTDISMPGINGIEATRILKQRFPQVNVLALSMYNDESTVLSMLQVGANGYLLKNTDSEELIRAIKTVLTGGTYLSAGLSEHLTQTINLGRAGKLPVQELSAREKEIVLYICEGHTSKFIAGKLGLSQRTIETYRESIYRKTGAINMAGVVLYAIKKGIYTVTNNHTTRF